MKTRTEQILVVLNVLSWVVFIGLLIKAGAILISYSVSLFNPEGAEDLYKGMNLSWLRQSSLWYYTTVVSSIAALLGMKAYTAFLVIKVLSKINLANPFTMEIALLVEKVSYFIAATWVVAVLTTTYSGWLQRSGEVWRSDASSFEFLFLAGVIFVISQVFKRGIEIQADNELTI
ncbi:DUF2975 domain-containing protein [Persicitalea sp.]|uniref:DUF2975 domain-containing protein n=1 Tax=Persicitalea sp. TaxID=3100273 RepID=UPI003593B335